MLLKLFSLSCFSCCFTAVLLLLMMMLARAAIRRSGAPTADENHRLNFSQVPQQRDAPGKEYSDEIFNQFRFWTASVVDLPQLKSGSPSKHLADR